LDGQGQTAHGALISYIDLSQGRRAIVGMTSGAHTLSAGPAVSGPAPETTGEKRTDQDTANGATRDRPADTSTVERKTGKEPSNRSASEKKSDKAKNTDRRPQ
jgi:hypothetical protein